MEPQANQTDELSASLSSWSSTLANNDIVEMHNYITGTKFVDLKKALDMALDQKSVSGTFVSIAAMCHYDIFMPSMICNYLMNIIQDNGIAIKDVDEPFVFKVLDLFMKHNGPYGPFLKGDFKYARQYKSGIVFRYLRKRAQKKWSFILFCSYCSILWKRWILWRLQPDSSFIRKKALCWAL